VQRIYTYVGPKEIKQLLVQPAYRALIQQPEDVREWLKSIGQRSAPGQKVTTTFIVDLKQQLWIADQHSEHVVCAAGEDVLAAGEMTFAVTDQSIAVVEITNQSTGYCPDPPSWTAVAAVLDHMQIRHPAAFTTEFIFRRCNTCGTINIVKDAWFECAVCQAPLNRYWNFPIPS
jgi:hypothetical protein